jgi:pyridoxine 5-phosphate synthase
LEQNIRTLQAAGIKVSLFIDPEPDQIKAAAELGAEMIELHTGTFALTTGKEHDNETERLRAGAELGHTSDYESMWFIGFIYKMSAIFFT